MADEKVIAMTWTGGLRFEGGKPGGPVTLMDGKGVAGPSPMDALLASAASCSAIDIVVILEKMRQPLATLSVEATGTRRDTEPKRFIALHLLYRATGEGLDDAKVRRAAALSVEKYCSVLATLAPDVALTWDVAVG